MLLKTAIVAGIRDGRIKLAFRRWPRARVKVGSEIRTALGVVGITAIDAVAMTAISEVDALKAGYETRAALLGDLKRFGSGQIYRIGLKFAGADPRLALREKALIADDADNVAVRLARLDKASKDGPWTRSVLSLIEQKPALRAADLAAGLGWETHYFKIRVRKLKELGLTESLETGYRISPRGAAYLKAAPRGKK